MRKAKRIFGVLLISCMVFSMIPGNVFAEESVSADGIAEEAMESAATSEPIQTAEGAAVFSDVGEADTQVSSESILDTTAVDEMSDNMNEAVPTDTEGFPSDPESPSSDPESSKSTESDTESQTADIGNNSPADPESEDAASEDNESDSDVSEEKEEQATRTEYIYDDGTVRVTAYLSDAAAISDEAYLSVIPVTPQTPGYNYDAYMAALNEGTDFTYDAANTFLYDYAFILDGVEVQPAFGEVTVVSEFRYPLLTDYIGAQSAADISLIHMPLVGDAASYITTQAAVDIRPSDIARVGIAPSCMGVDLAAQQVTFRTSSFSVWAIVNTAAGQQSVDDQEEIVEEEESEQHIGVADSRFVRIAGTRYMLNVSYGAEAGIPEDAQFIAVPLSENHTEYAEYEERAVSAVEESAEMLVLFDLTIVDADGVEVTPQAPLTITMSYGSDIEADADVYAVHFVDTSAVDVPTADGEEPVTAAEAEIEVIEADTSGGAATFEASGFSVYAIVYTVDFEYEVDGKVYQFSINGGTSISLKELLVILGVIKAENADAFVAEIDSVVFSNPALVEVVKIPGDWMLNSLQAFSTEESLTVTMKDGSVFEIRVTDLQESYDLKDFLYNAVVTGATQDSEGRYQVEAGKEYNIILSFAESSAHQFDNHATLTYTMPEGLTILSPQTGDLKINIVYKGRTYQVDATYDLGTDGRLEIKFVESDPDFHHLENSTNVSFRFSYNGAFDGSEEQILFSQDIERDIVFEEPEPGQAYVTKSGTFDEETGKFTYTITVNATGDVTKVNVKDVISGNALIFNNDVRVSGNSSSYRDNGAANGFDYTFASMQEGEVITITYSASVDFTKDTDKDGKISVDQTKNTVTVEPDGGDPHSSEYSHEISFKTTRKSNGTSDDTTADGDKIYKWTITYNELRLASAGGDTIKDTIAADSTEYMKYYGEGLSIKVIDKNGNTVDTRNVSYTELQSYSDSSWTYKIPEGDSTPYMYEITYYTVVDMEKVEGTGNTVTVINDANGTSGSADVTPESVISVTKSVDSFTTEKVNWSVTLGVPENGLTQAVVTDTIPHIWLNNKNIYDLLEAGSLQIEGLLDGESYSVDDTVTGQVKITFYQDPGKSITGLKAAPGGHTITVKLTTLVDQEWLQAGYESGSWEQNHTNSVSFNGKTATATVVFGEPGIEKKGDALTDSQGNITGLKYTVVLKGVSETPVSVLDTFDTSILEVDASKTTSWDHMRIWGGNQWSQDAGRMPVSYTDTGDGIILTADSVPMQDDGKYYPYYKIIYYLKVKDGVDLKALAIANGGEYDVDNTVNWGDHESEFTYKVEYDYLDKQLLNEGELGGTNRTAQYQITFNPSKATLNEGSDMTMTDVLSANLSVEYGSIRITTDPAGQSVRYSLSGGEGGTTVATYIIPDSTKVTIYYDASVRGNGSQTIVNKVSVNGKDETVVNVKSYGSASEGEGAQASFKIVKVDGYDASIKLQGVSFKVFCENPNLDFNNGGGLKELTLVTDENGEITFDGNAYTFYFDEVYHVQELEAPENYGKISFDYLVTLTNDMAKVDYGHYIYYYSDSMQIKNWPLEGLVVEKQVDSDEAEDKDRYYRFKVSILNEDGTTVNTDYNEKNGDDQFENGVVEFQIKDKEQKMFWGFRKGTKYRVEEIDAAGFATSVTYNVFDENGNIIETITDNNSTSHSGELTQEDEVIIFKNSKHNETGSLKITKNVTVNGKTTTGTEADGTYSFTIQKKEAEEGANPVATATITITNGVSNTATVGNLDAGTYVVTETVPDGLAVDANDKEVVVEAGATAEVATVAFTNNKTAVGSLKITKNVTVNGAATDTTLADGTYTFTITGPDEYSSTQPLTITNGVSEEVQVDSLVPGEYTITETDPENGTSLVGTNGVKVEVTANNTENVPTAAFVNNKDVGSLEITKNVTVNGKTTTGTEADGTYSFTIQKKEAEEGADPVATATITITNGVSSTATVGNLEAGTYIVTETVPEGMAVDANDKEVEVTAGATAQVATVAFTNNKTEVGSLKITKNVMVNGKATSGTLADGTYEFTISGPDNYSSTQTLTITNGAAAEVQVDSLIPGEYTITETDPVNGTSLVGTNGVKVNVTANNTENIPTAAFINNKDVGSLTITKNVTVNGKATSGTEADGTYSFTIQKKDAEEGADPVATATITITNGESSTATVENLEAGIYVVTETVPEGMAVDGNNKEVVVEAGKTATAATVAFTNDKTLVGSLKITKNVTVNGEATTGTLADGTYEFTISGPDGYSSTKTITIDHGVAKTEQIDNLVPGEYTITETEPENGTSLIGENPVKVTVEANNTANIPTAEFTNNKDVGSLEITKNVKVNGKTTSGTEADGTYSFTIQKKDAEEGADPVATATITITNGESSTATVENLEAGIYVVTETVPEGMAVDGNNKEVVVEAGKTATAATVAFTNDKIVVGSLKITKNVTVNGEATTGTLADGTYEFTISGPDNYSSTQTLTITNGAAAEVQVDSLIPGEYTITETDPVNGTSLVGTNGVKVNVTANNTENIPTAAFINNKDVGSLTITKNVTVNGKAMSGTEADGTYSFTIRKKDAEEGAGPVATATITITNGVSSTATVGNLEAGTYIVTETVPEGMAVDANDKEVEVTAGATAQVATVAFTNNKTEVGSLKITKNVTVNGKATSGTLADGTYEFTISGPDNYSSTQTLTITNGVAAEVTVGDLIPGTYTVSEDTSKNPEGMSLVGNNDIEINVAANNTASIPTAEFINNYVATSEAQFSVKKETPGITGSTKKFTFTLTPTSDDAKNAEKADKYSSAGMIEITGAATGSFDKITFSAEGTYTYTISEVQRSEPGYTYDKSEYEVTVSVTEDGSGTLQKAMTVKQTKDQKGDAIEDAETQTVDTVSVDYSNTYTAEGSIDLDASKHFEEGNMDTRTYYFEIYEAVEKEDGTFIIGEQPVLIGKGSTGKTNPTESTVDFKYLDNNEVAGFTLDKLGFTNEDLRVEAVSEEETDTYATEKTFHYIICEKAPDDAVAIIDGKEVAYKDATSAQKSNYKFVGAEGSDYQNVVFDNARKVVHVKVTDNGNGTLKVETVNDKGEPVKDVVAEFYNTWAKAKLRLTKTVTEYVDGEKVNAVFNFTVRGTGTWADGTPFEPVSTNIHYTAATDQAQVAEVEVPYGITNLTVEETFSGNYEPDAKVKTAVRTDKDTDGTPLYTVSFTNKLTRRTHSKSIVNKYGASENQSVIFEDEGYTIQERIGAED